MIQLFNKIFRWIFFAIIVRFIVLVVIGINFRKRSRLPEQGPAIIVANHNSHLDTLVLMSLFRLRALPSLHPVAAADYFLRNRGLTWFARKIIGIIPIVRDSKTKTDPLIPCYSALDQNQILILFPEGTRGEPEQLSSFKRGVAYLAERYPTVPVIPIYMHGLGKSLPKGTWLFVPFFCDIFIGDPLYGKPNHQHFMQQLNETFQRLVAEGGFEQWH